MNHFFIFLSILLLNFAANANDAPLTIATWNMAWFSNKSDRIQAKREPSDYLYMKQVADWISADVMAFQEVDNQKVLENIFPPEKYKIFLSDRAENFLRKKSAIHRMGCQTAFTDQRSKRF